MPRHDNQLGGRSTRFPRRIAAAGGRRTPRFVALTSAVLLVVALVGQGAAAAYPARNGGSGATTTGTPASVARIVLGPARATIAPGQGVVFSVRAFDRAGHPIGDITSTTRFSISPDGSCRQNRCTAARAGAHRVTATTAKGSHVVTATAVLVVEPPAPPAGHATASGSPRGGSAQGGSAHATGSHDRQGARRTQTGTTAPGASAGPTTRTGPATAGGTARAPRSNRPGPAARLVLTPTRTFIAPGDALAYTAVAFDAAGRSLGDVTARATFRITFSARSSSTRADGSCAGAVCTATRLGRHTVTAVATLGTATVTGNAALQVVPRHRRTGTVPGLASIELVPGSAVVESGDGLTYAVNGFDRQHRLIGDVTSLAQLTISPDGSCTGARCTATEPGLHIVTASVPFTKFQVTDTAELLVTPHLVGLHLEPRTALAEVGQGVRFTAYGVDAAGRRVDLTDVSRFSMGSTGTCSGPVCTATSPGGHTVTGRVTVAGRTLEATASLRAIPAIAAIRLRPDRAEARRGAGVTFTALGVDGQGRPVMDLTALTVFTITAPGSCTGATCAATSLGDHTVMGVVRLPDRIESDTAVLHVTRGVLGVTLDATARTIPAGGAVTYAARAVDDAGRPGLDVTAAAVFTITAPGTCRGNSCTATTAQRYTVTARVTIEGATFTATAPLEVVPGPVERVALDPARVSAPAGTSTTFRAFGSDAFGNRVGEVTDRTTFTVAAPGTCGGAACTATKAGEYTVTGSVVGAPVAGSATLVVEPGPLQSIVLDPPRARATAGEAVTFRARGTDAFGNDVGELTAFTSFTMTAPGSCRGGTCSATTAQQYAVTGTVIAGGREVQGAAVVVVVPGPLTRLVLDPPGAIATAGAGVAYRAYGSDAFGNRLGDVTSSAAITIGPDGSCTAGICAATKVGPHTVTGRADLGNGPVTATGNLLVMSTEVVTLRLNPWSAQVRPGQKATYTATGLDRDGHAVTDLTDYAGFSITPDGSCIAETCTASRLGSHTVTGTVRTPAGSIAGGSALEVVAKGTQADQGAGEIAGLQLSPKTAQVDAGAGITYIATGVDANGNPVADLSGQTRFVISPDGSCDGSTCIATTPGPHTVTGTITGAPGGATGTATSTPTRTSSGVTVSRSTLFRTVPAAPAAPLLTASASLQVIAGPGSCLVTPSDLIDLTATTHEVPGGASVQVDGRFEQRFATCPVLVLLNGDALSDSTTIATDGSIAAAGTVQGDPLQTGTVVVTTVDGRQLKDVAFRIPSGTGTGWPPWVLLALVLAVLAALANAERNRRQRRWVAQHVSVAPVPVVGAVTAHRQDREGRSHSVGLVPRTERGTIDITEEDR